MMLCTSFRKVESEVFEPTRHAPCATVRNQRLKAYSQIAVGSTLATDPSGEP